jgi:hypothetical protein
VFLPEKFEDVSKLFLNDIENTENKKTSIIEGESLIQVLASNKYPQVENNNQKHKEEQPERFNSIINFSNFLLHVLRIQVNNYEESKIIIDDKVVPLDDKRLVETFQNEVDTFVYGEKGEFNKDETNREFAQFFSFNLLKAKFCFDHYILKKELNKDVWSLKQLGTAQAGTAKYTNTFNNNNNEIVMLLSMFHVSYSSRLYKHWLNGVLNYTIGVKDIDVNKYKAFLQKFAKKILFDRYLSAQDSVDYHSIIYVNQKVKNENPQYNKLNKGTEVENFVFNYLDYLIWKQDPPKYKDFQFAFRNSVEHHYPQNPINKEDKLNPSSEIPKGVDDFGNLCLLSRSKNSKLSNYLPSGKADHYRRSGMDSIKQMLMIHYGVNWGTSEIIEHRNKMISLFEEVFNDEPELA